MSSGVEHRSYKARKGFCPAVLRAFGVLFGCIGGNIFGIS